MGALKADDFPQPTWLAVGARDVANTTDSVRE